LEKIDKCLRYLKQWVLRCLPEKRKRDEDSPFFLIKMF
jgi:hypothetical protein